MCPAQVQETLVRNAPTLARRCIGGLEGQQGHVLGVEQSLVGAVTHQPVIVSKKKMALWYLCITIMTEKKIIKC